MDLVNTKRKAGSDFPEAPTSKEAKLDGDLSPELVSAPNSLTDLSSTSVTSGTADVPAPGPNAIITNSDLRGSNSPQIKRKKNSSKGRHGDPRMHRAVAARLLNPELSLLESLLEGGFTFPEGTEGSGKSDRNIYDSDGVLLCQRKNQLSRRLRLAKKRQQASRAEGGLFASGMGQQDNNDSRTIQNMLLNGQLPVAGSEVPIIHPSHQFGTAFFPTQAPSNLDPSSLQGNDSRQMKKSMENNFDQYLQLAVGIRPDQLQALRYPANMIPAFPGGANPFQQFAFAQQPQNFLGNMDATASLNPGMNLQNMQMTPMIAMPAAGPAQAQMNNDLSRLLMNRSMFMNTGDTQDDNAQKS